MVEWVTNGYEKKLLIIWVGYSAQVQGKNLVLSLGYAHKVNFPIPEGIEMKTEQDPKGNTVIFVSGISKEQVGEVTAKIRSLKKPEPYKGKGIRYFDEFVKIKPGKSAKRNSIRFNLLYPSEKWVIWRINSKKSLEGIWEESTELMRLLRLKTLNIGFWLKDQTFMLKLKFLVEMVK